MYNNKSKEGYISRIVGQVMEGVPSSYCFQDSSLRKASRTDNRKLVLTDHNQRLHPFRGTSTKGNNVTSLITSGCSINEGTLVAK